MLVVAALLRLPDLTTRGTWEADQGHDMLVLRALVRDGVVPLLGPPTSIGDVHHGAWYYYLLSPAAYLTGGDSPLAVVALIALVGIAAVAVVWWFARSVAGPLAGVIAGLAVAISTAAVDESTFIWNPNLIGLSSAIALAAAWRAWSGGHAGWWLVAAIGTAVTMQCHVLGVALLPVILVPFVMDAGRRPLGWTAVGWVAVFVLAYLPLALNELTSGFSETQAAIAYVAGEREASETAIPIRFAIVGLRVVSWPLVGLITSGFAIGVLATAAIAGIVAWRRRNGVVRWLGIALLWSTAFLTIAAPSLAAVVPGLPNDHYHAFADPMVFTLLGVGGAAAIAIALRRDGALPVVPVAAGIALLLLAGWNLTHLPPAVHPDGGYPAGRAAGDRVDATLTAAGVTRDDVVLVRSLPDFKSTEAMAYPLALLGRTYIAETPRGVAPGSVDVTGAEPVALVLLCDDRFADAIGAECGGPAEDASGAAWGPLMERFEAQPDRWVSLYGPRTAS